MLTIIDSKLSNPPPARDCKPLAVILHQTGDTDLDKIVNYYSTNGSHIAPHYLVEVTPSIRQFVSEDHVAYHAPIKDAEGKLYRMGFNTWAQWVWDEKNDQPVHVDDLAQPNYNFWRARWGSRGQQSPLDFVTRDRPNLYSVGIEIQQPTAKFPEFFTPEQYALVAQLVFDVCKRNDIPIDRDHVLTHSDVCPLRRTTKEGPYDPPMSFNFNRLWDGMLGLR